MTRTTGVRRMAEPPELWTFLVTNAIILVIGGALAAFSFVAYRRDHESRFLVAAIGFALVTVGGGGVEPFYQVIFKDGYALAGRELLAMQSVEAFLVAAGLGCCSTRSTPPRPGPESSGSTGRSPTSR